MISTATLADIPDSEVRSWPLGSATSSEPCTASLVPDCFAYADTISGSMPLRPLLQKNLIVRSNQTGTKADMEEALALLATGQIVPEQEIVDLRDINEALDRIKQGRVLGKLVANLSGSRSTSRL
jgi:hypothetical protein